MRETKIHINRRILRLALPNIASNITVPLLGMADMAVTAHLSSPVYAGAVALGSLIFNFLYLGFGFLRMSTVGFTSQAFGRRDFQEVSAFLLRGLVVSISLSFIFLILQLPIEKLSFRLLSGSEEVENLARSYFYIRIWAAPATLSLMVLNGWFLGLQNAIYPMTITIFINVLNILLNYFLGIKMGLNSNGVALASVISQYTGLALSILFLFLKYTTIIRQTTFKTWFVLSRILAYIKVNFDILIRTLSIIFALAFFTDRSAAEGDVTLAANQLLLQFFFLFSYFIDGFANAAETLTGEAIGQRNHVLFKLILKKIFVFATLITALFFLIYFLTGKYILFGLTDIPDLREMGAKFIFWVFLIPLTSFAAFIWDGVYIGAIASSILRNTMLVATFMIYIPAYYVFHFFWGNHGLWLALNVYLLSRSVLLTYYFPTRILRLFD